MNKGEIHETEAANSSTKFVRNILLINRKALKIDRTYVVFLVTERI